MVVKLLKDCQRAQTQDSKKSETVKPYHFELCQWQKSGSPRAWYLAYRWCVAGGFLAVLVWSVASRWPVVIKWPAYLTNWAYCCCVLQSLLGVYIMQSAWLNRNKYQSAERPVTWLHRTYWLMQILAVDASVTVSLIYWVVVHNPAIHGLGVMNLLVHLGNSMVMLVDLSLVLHSCRYIFVLAPMTLGATWSFFSYIYYINGGTDWLGGPFLYEPMDWRKPTRASIVACMCMVLTVVVHTLVYGLFKLRMWVSRVTGLSPAHGLLPSQPTLLLREKAVLIDVVNN